MGKQTLNKGWATNGQLSMSTAPIVNCKLHKTPLAMYVNPGHLTVAFSPRPGWRIRGESIVALVPHGARPTQRLDCGLCTTSG